MVSERLLTSLMRALSALALARGGALADDSSIRHPLLAPSSRRPSMLYIHIPFCRELCPFCSFHRLRFDEPLAERYFDALEGELDFHERVGNRYRYVYIGGGTPTVLPDRLTRLVKSLYRRWRIESVSVEANPDALEHELLRRLSESGINRLSVGVQSFADLHLERMKRLEKYGSGSAIASRLAAAAGNFDTLNIDLIYNLPGQTELEIRRDAEIVNSLSLDQVTWYPLMHSTPTSNRHASREYRHFALIDELLADEFDRSSVWCYSRGARMIDEYVIDSHDYAGAGSGAFGLVGGVLYANTFSIPDYCRGVEEHGAPPLALVRGFPPLLRSLYRMLMEFFGGTIEIASPRGAPELSSALIARALALIGAGVISGGKVRLSSRGRYWLLVLMREFFTGVNSVRRACLDVARNPPILTPPQPAGRRS